MFRGAHTFARVLITLHVPCSDEGQECFIYVRNINFYTLVNEYSCRVCVNIINISLLFITTKKKEALFYIFFFIFVANNCTENTPFARASIRNIPDVGSLEEISRMFPV